MVHTHIGTLVFFIQLLCYAQLSSANNILIAKEQKNRGVPQNQQPNFIVSLPHVTTTEVLQHINDTRSALSKRKTALTKIEKKRSFNTRDSAISLIVPGGILYAAIIKLRHIDAKKQLNNVTQQLNDLNQDLIAFRSADINNTLIATLH